MDGIPLGELLTPELTTLALDLRDVGRAAVELLDGLLTGSIEPGGPGTDLVLRHRAGAARNRPERSPGPTQMAPIPVLLDRFVNVHANHPETHAGDQHVTRFIHRAR